jgi:TctA family transporter
MIGMFACREVLRFATDRKPVMAVDRPFGNVFTGMWALLKKYPVQLLRGSALGTLVGALPGAGADIAAWMSYAMSKRFSKEPEKFGTGHVEGIVESGAANNSALGGAWIPALVFGIPGDSITAIAIGVLYLKNMNPGPTLFVDNPQNIYAVFIVFILAQLLMLPFGWMAIKVAKQILRIPAAVLMPLILLFCIVGSFAINNSMFGVIVMGVAGVVGFFMERWGFPVAPTILGVVLGTMLEEHFFSSLIKADGNLIAFFQRPIAGTLGALTLMIWAPWGELLTTASMARGAAGCVTDGLVRDIKQIRQLGFPVFHGGIGPLDSKGRGKVIAIDVPVSCGGVHIRSGDLVVGDADGIVVLPVEIERRCLELALEKVEGEDRTRAELQAGMKLAEVFARHGVL